MVRAVFVIVVFFFFFFFFSSRRRHTRLQGDWSSDVCSSDLWWSSVVGRWSVVVSRWALVVGHWSPVHRRRPRTVHRWLFACTWSLDLRRPRTGSRRLTGDDWRNDDWGRFRVDW